MNYRTLLLASVGVMILVGGVLASWVGLRTSGGVRLQAVGAEHDLGLFFRPLLDPLDVHFGIKNTGYESVDLCVIRSNYSCLENRLDRSRIRPGEVASLTARWRVPGSPGQQRMQVAVEGRTPKDVGQLTLRTYATVADVISVTPRLLQFGQVTDGSQTELVPECRSELPDAPREPKSVRCDDSAITVTRLSDSVGPVTNYAITLSNDGAYRGRFRSRVLVETGDPRQGTIEIRIVADLVGPVVARPTSVAFPCLAAGAPQQREIRLDNLPGEPFEILKTEASASWLRVVIRVDETASDTSSRVVVLHAEAPESLSGRFLEHVSSWSSAEPDIPLTVNVLAVTRDRVTAPDSADAAGGA